MTGEEVDLLARLEGMPLEKARAAIRNRQLGVTFDSPLHALAESWLAGKDEEARAAREERTLAVDSDANRIASRASRWALYVVISAIIAIAVPMRDQISALIFGAP